MGGNTVGRVWREVLATFQAGWSSNGEGWRVKLRWQDHDMLFTGLRANRWNADDIGSFVG